MENYQQFITRLAAGETLPDESSVHQVIKDYGLEAKQTSDGWQLEQPLELLNPKTLESLVTDAAKLELSTLDLHWSLGSTNTFVQNLSLEANFHGYACMAERQTAGKGRRGRNWVSPFGKNIYLSVGWKIPTSVSLDGLSLAVGCAVTRAIKAQNESVNVALKWPNDILIEGGKTAGILVELASGDTGFHHLVVGIGVNLHLSNADSAYIDQAWNVVQQVSRNKLAASLLSELVDCLVVFRRDGFAPFQSEWNSLDAFADMEVNLISAGKTETGTARGVDASGHLILDTPSGAKKINAGEVSLRASPES